MQTLPTFDMVLFGGTGDLAMRKLLPALYRRRAAGHVTGESRVIGAAPAGLSRQDYLAQVRASCESRVGREFDAMKWQEFADHLQYVQINAQSQNDFARLAQVLRGHESHTRVFFLSTGPICSRRSARRSRIIRW